MAPLDILIVGCSIAGPTLATFLLSSQAPATEKPRIVILERSSALRKEGQNIDIRLVGVEIIRKLGLEDAIRAATTGEQGTQWVTTNNTVWSSFQAGNDDRMHMPTSGIEVMRGTLSDILYRRSQAVSQEVEKAGGAPLKYVFGDSIEELKQDGAKVQVRFAKSGETRLFDLVVGADGVHSQTRKQTWGQDGEKDRMKNLNLYGAFFSIPRGETDTEWRRCYHTHGRRVMMLRPSGRSERTTAFIHIVNENDRRFQDAVANGHENLTAQKELMNEYFQDAGWESERIMGEMMKTDDFYYESMAQIKMDSWSRGRIVLLGDAAYCASPMSGMGTTLALFGAYNLAGALTHRANDPAAAFGLYEKKMRPLVDQAQKLMPGLLRILNPETSWGLWIVDTIIMLLVKSGLVRLLMSMKSPSRDTVLLEDYGLKQPC